MACFFPTAMVHPMTRPKKTHTDPLPAVRFLLLAFLVMIGLGIPLITLAGILVNFPTQFRFDFEWGDLFIAVPAMILWLALVGGSWYEFWNVVASKHRTPEQLARVQSFPDARRPEISADSLVYRFNKRAGKTGAIYVDHARQMLHFYKCHTPQKFFTLGPSRWFSCRVNELKGTHCFALPRVEYRGNSMPARVDRNPESLTVVTTSGKATIPGTEPGYENIRDTFRELKPVADPEFSTEHPAMGCALFFGAIVGGAAGLIVAGVTSYTKESELYGALWGGIAVGAASSWLLTWLSARVLKINLAVPMASSLTGGIVVLLAGAPFIGVINRGRYDGASVVIVLAILFAIVCGIVSLVAQFNKRRDANSKPEKTKSL